LEVWNKMLEGSVIQGIELDKQFLVRDLWKAASDDEDDEQLFPRELFEAVVRRLLDKESAEASKPGGKELKCMYIKPLPYAAHTHNFLVT
jgi:sister chromatid cohesion protein DCC1